MYATKLSHHRASVLLSNIERFGIRNAVVTNETPERLCGHFPGYFDRVLVDAPCSGEGLFRREPDAVAQWGPRVPVACAERQLAILSNAQKAVKEGGILVYSTCTFSPEEDEGVVDAFLKQYPDFEIEDIPASFGVPGMPKWANACEKLSLSRRIFPSDSGEGHFVARMRRKSGPSALVKLSGVPKLGSWVKLFSEFYDSQFSEKNYGDLYENGGRIFILPTSLPDLSGLKVLRAGVLAGRVKGTRFEPEHALYMAAKPKTAKNYADFSSDDENIAAFLHGEQITAQSNTRKGYAEVCVDGYPIGFAKASDGVLKNHYPKGLRNL